jgi:hypothetical protein
VLAAEGGCRAIGVVRRRTRRDDLIGAAEEADGLALLEVVAGGEEDGKTSFVLGSESGGWDSLEDDEVVRGRRGCRRGRERPTKQYGRLVVVAP